MRIGLIVDGQAEFRSLPKLYSRIQTAAVILKPLYADIQPRANVTKIVRSSLTAARVLQQRNVDRLILCMDHERRPECIPTWRVAVEQALAARCAQIGIHDVKVVLKAEMYENWLVADVGAFGKKPARFRFRSAHAKQIAPNRADNVDAIKLLKSIARNDPYDKIRDAIALMSIIDPYACAANSRSFRRFLRVVGCKCYVSQSKAPTS